MDELRIPKHHFAVELRLSDGNAKRAQLFLGDRARAHGGSERLIDLLEGEATFLPGAEAEGGQICLINRDNIVLARVDPQAAETDEAEGEQRSVELTLASGEKLRGQVQYLLPPEKSRLVDFLNQTGRFVRLQEADRVAWIARRHIVLVEDLGNDP